MKLGTLHIGEEKDIIKIRQILKLLCYKLEANNIETIEFITAASELARYLYEQSLEGDMAVELLTAEPKQGFKLVFTVQGLISIRSEDVGIGFLGSTNLVDALKIDTNENGTTFNLVKWLGNKNISSTVLENELKSVFNGLTGESTLESLKIQNREMIEILEAFYKKNNEYEELSEELKRTNREIIVALTELDQTNKEMELFVETIPDGILILKPDGNVKLINRKFKDISYGILGLELAVNSNIKDLKDDQNPILGVITGAVLNKEEIEKTINIGDNYSFQVIIRLVRLKANSPPSAIIIELHDITPLVEFDKLRKQFVSSVSHELRTPLTSITLSINNLLKYGEKIPETNKKALIQIIRESAYTLTEMVDDLLILSRVDSKKLDLKWESFNLMDTVEAVIFQLHSNTLEKELSIKTEFDEKIQLIGDMKRISQVLRILLDNAIKYSPKNSTVVISTVNHYQGPYNTKGIDGCLIQIIDHGVGIKEKNLSHLFERFFRCEEVKNLPGTGLGLSIAKELVTAHDGEIFVKSEYGKGSTFSVFLPYLKQKMSNET
ncbi:MAG: ATP-binding protein [Candidatus Helarchaeota archaeon]|nr:ATP-binding protein [Candidatus Helarchaeota archaeon]